VLSVEDKKRIRKRENYYGTIIFIRDVGIVIQIEIILRQ
jgi:hypothetical protein